MDNVRLMNERLEGAVRVGPAPLSRKMTFLAPGPLARTIH